MNIKPLVPLVVLSACLCLAMGADTFWQVYFSLLSRTYDATVTNVMEVSRRGSRVTYERYQLDVSWTDEQGREKTGQTETDRSRKFLVGDPVRIQYASGNGLIRLASHQTIISPILFVVSLLALIGLLVWIVRATSPAPVIERETTAERKPKQAKRTRPIKRLRPIDPDADR